MRHAAMEFRSEQLHARARRRSARLGQGRRRLPDTAMTASCACTPICPTTAPACWPCSAPPTIAPASWPPWPSWDGRGTRDGRRRARPRRDHDALARRNGAHIRQGQAVARLPLFEVIRIGDAPPRPVQARPRAARRHPRARSDPHHRRPCLRAHARGPRRRCAARSPVRRCPIRQCSSWIPAAASARRTSNLTDPVGRATLEALVRRRRCVRAGLSPRRHRRRKDFHPSALPSCRPASSPFRSRPMATRARGPPPRLRQPGAERQRPQSRRSAGGWRRRGTEGAARPGARPWLGLPDGGRGHDGLEAPTRRGRLVAGARVAGADRRMVLAPRPPRRPMDWQANAVHRTTSPICWRHRRQGSGP